MSLGTLCRARMASPWGPGPSRANTETLALFARRGVPAVLSAHVPIVLEHPVTVLTAIGDHPEASGVEEVASNLTTLAEALGEVRPGTMPILPPVISVVIRA